jgi:uncharacterized protein (TIGR03437 family)
LIVQGGPITPIDPTTASAQLLAMGFHDPLPLPIQELLDPWSVLVLIPPETPLGQAGIRLNYNGQSSTTASVNVVATNFGLYSAGSGGTALAQNIANGGWQLNNLTHPAHPHDYVTLWGSGLGSAAMDQINVLLGGHPFPIVYAGPSGEFAGLDQINFEVPDDPAIPQGCYVAVNIEIGNTISNLATLSLSRSDGPCQHPFRLTPDQLAKLDSGGRVYVGQIDLYSTIGPPPGPSLSPENGYVRMDFADAQFLSYDAGGLSVISPPLFADDYLVGCMLTGGASARFLALLNPLNVGDQVSVQGPSGKQLTLLPQGAGPPSRYSGSEPTGQAVMSPDLLSAPFFSAGEWQVGASGNSDVEPFTSVLTVPNPIQITNYGQITVVDHTKDLTIVWDPTTYSGADFVAVQLYGQAPAQWFAPSSAVSCRVPATAGTLTISAAMLASFQPATGSLSLALGRKPGTATLFTIDLEDGTPIPAVFQYHSAEWIFLQFH